MVVLLKDMFIRSENAVRIHEELTEWFRVTLGLKHGCDQSHKLLSLLLEAVISWALKFINKEL